jgi:hypothetical protein
MTEMDIVAELEAAPTPVARNPCQVGIMRQQRPDLAAQFDRVIEALREGRIHNSTAQIAAKFSDYGFPIGPQVVGRHRRGDCQWCLR